MGRPSHVDKHDVIVTGRIVAIIKLCYQIPYFALCLYLVCVMMMMIMYNDLMCT